MKLLTSFLCLGALGLAACSSRPEPAEPAPPPAPVRSLLPAIKVLPESGLGPQPLASDECGLFLWSQTDPTQFIFFQKASTGIATMKIGAANVDVTQTANSGAIFGEFMTEQGFAAPDGTQVTLNVVPGEPLQGGQRVEAGHLSITTTEGWRTLIPVLGVRACQP